MTWADFYLICFIVGFCFSVLSLLSGGLHLHTHLPHWMDFVHHDFTTHHAGGYGDQPSFFNFPTIMTFLAWFGGIGFLLTQVYPLWFLLTLGIATAAGVIGASLVFLFLARILLAHDHTMNPADYKIVGILGTVSSAIQTGGTGEIVYSQGGSRRYCGARSDNGEPIAKGAEVVVTRFEKGVAYVCQWERMLEKNE